MSYSINQAMIDQFNAAVIMLSQQRDSRLQKTCQIASVTGKSFYAERIGATEMYERTSRHQDVRYVGIEHSRRKGTTHDMEWAELLDKADTNKYIIDPKGKYVQSAVAASNRSKDSWILAALGGVAHAGEAGATSVNVYDSGECRLIAGDGTLVTAGSDATNTTDTALTYAKVLLAKTLLDQAEIDPDRPRYFVTNNYNINQLLTDTTLTGEEMKAVRNIRDGKVDKFLGFEFIPVEYRASGTGLRYHATDTTCVRSYAYAYGAITFGIGQDLNTRIEREPKKNADQILADMTVGAERNEGPAVVEILLKAAA